MRFLDLDGKVITDGHQLPKLMVLTGLNGSGKTRGLKALQSADTDGTLYINYRDFLAQWDMTAHAGIGLYHTINHNANHIDGQVIDLEQINDWKYQTPSNFGVLRYEHTLNDSEKLKWIESNCTSENFARLAWTFFTIFPEAIELAFSAHASLLSDNPDKAQEYWRGLDEDQVPTAYKSESIKSRLPIHCISDDKVAVSLDRLKRLHPLQFNLASLVREYLEKQNQFAWDRAYNDGVAPNSLFEIFRETHPDPSDHINSILKRLADDEANVFQFEVRSSASREHTPYVQIRNPPPIEISLIDTRTGVLRKLDELSSGEQTLLALATLTYTHKYIQPKRALYLDEIDASLHPSMIRSMLEILQEHSDETRIYLATHSPNTVALAPEESLFFMHEGSARKINRTEAIEGLTQGYFTTEGVTSVFRSINGKNQEIIVISEGYNVDYLIPILKKLGYDDRIYVHQWANPSGKGTGNLKPLMALFAEMLTNSHKKFVFLFDCDVDPKKYIKDTDYVKGIFLCKTKFPKHQVKSGIENIIPDTILDALTKDIIKNKNGEAAIDKIYKNEVAKHFVAELKANKIDLELMRTALKDLLDLCSKK